MTTKSSIDPVVAAKIDRAAHEQDGRSPLPSKPARVSVPRVDHSEDNDDLEGYDHTLGESFPASDPPGNY